MAIFQEIVQADLVKKKSGHPCILKYKIAKYKDDKAANTTAGY